MRTATPTRLLLVAAALLAGACDDADSPLEPPVAADEAPATPASASLATGRWADGYLLAHLPTVSSYSPPSQYAYNRSGGTITVAKPAGTTGRYIATFSGLSALLGTRKTVQVTGYGSDASYCKPVGGYLVSDKIEVRCFNSATGVAANAGFSLVVLRKSPTRAFAFANQPTAADYVPAASGSWNPAGAIRVTRISLGLYKVTFAGLGAQLPSGVGGHVQVSAVGTGKAHCTALEEWGGSPSLSVSVRCYTGYGLPADTKFNVLFQLPAAHLGYVYADQPSAASYAPDPSRSSNPTGGVIQVLRNSTGEYIISWERIGAEIIESGNVQVTPVGLDHYMDCKVYGLGESHVGVRCFGPTGTRSDGVFTVLFGS